MSFVFDIIFDGVTCATRINQKLMKLTIHTAKCYLFVLYNEQESKMSKITNMPRSAGLFEDLFQFRYFSSRQKHLSSCLANIFTVRHVGQNKENNFAMTSTVRLYSNRSLASTNHRARSIQFIVYPIHCVSRKRSYRSV